MDVFIVLISGMMVIFTLILGGMAIYAMRVPEPDMMRGVAKAVFDVHREMDVQVMASLKRDGTVSLEAFISDLPADEAHYKMYVTEDTLRVVEMMPSYVARAHHQVDYAGIIFEHSRIFVYVRDDQGNGMVIINNAAGDEWGMKL